MRRIGPLALAVILAVGAAACEKTGDPVPVPTPIAAPTATEQFTGTLLALGSDQYEFKITTPSEVDVTLTTVTSVAIAADPSTDPPTPASPAKAVDYGLTITVGQPSITTLGVTCTNLKSVVTSAGVTPQLKGQSLAGTFCVQVSDPSGALPQAVNFIVSVAHS
jgi:hypothetical protein